MELTRPTAPPGSASLPRRSPMSSFSQPQYGRQQPQQYGQLPATAPGPASAAKPAPHGPLYGVGKNDSRHLRRRSAYKPDRPKATKARCGGRHPRLRLRPDQPGSERECAGSTAPRHGKAERPGHPQGSQSSTPASRTGPGPGPHRPRKSAVPRRQASTNAGSLAAGSGPTLRPPLPSPGRTTTRSSTSTTPPRPRNSRPTKVGVLVGHLTCL